MRNIKDCCRAFKKLLFFAIELSPLSCIQHVFLEILERNLPRLAQNTLLKIRLFICECKTALMCANKNMNKIEHFLAHNILSVEIVVQPKKVNYEWRLTVYLRNDLQILFRWCFTQPSLPWGIADDSSLLVRLYGSVHCGLAASYLSGIALRLQPAIHKATIFIVLASSKHAILPLQLQMWSALLWRQRKNWVSFGKNRVAWCSSNLDKPTCFFCKFVCVRSRTWTDQMQTKTNGNHSFAASQSFGRRAFLEGPSDNS